MTNGNTGSQVAPVVQENDMSKIREIFERAASAIAQASDLAKTVNELQHIVDGLKADVEKTRQNNSFLDEALSNTRRSRDEALAEASELRHKLATTEHDRDDAQGKAEQANQSLSNLSQDLEKARKDRDDAMLEAMQVREDLEKAQAQLKAIKSSLGIVEPKPEPQPVAQAQPEPTHPVPEPQQAIPMPAPEPEAQPHQAQPHRVYDSEPGFSWDKPNYWDSTQGKYYNEF